MTEYVATLVVEPDQVIDRIAEAFDGHGHDLRAMRRGTPEVQAKARAVLIELLRKVKACEVGVTNEQLDDLCDQADAYDAEHFEPEPAPKYDAVPLMERYRADQQLSIELHS